MAYHAPALPRPLTPRALAGALLLAVAAGVAWAQPVVVSDAWARATVPGQKATGVFMRLRSAGDARLVAVSSPAAGVAQIHEMRLEGDVMMMQALKNGLELPAGATVELKPGGNHLMLMDLKSPLAKGGSIALTLVLKDAKGAESRTELSVPVLAGPPMAHVHGN